MSLAPETERADGRHRARRFGGPAAAVTATIAAGSLALATYAAAASVGSPQPATAESAVSEQEPALASESIAGLTQEAGRAHAEARALRAQGVDALALSTTFSSTGLSSVREASERISAERKAEREAAEREAAEKAAAQAAERAAAEAAERAASEEAASRSAERQPAPQQQPQTPAPQPVASGDSRSIARSMLGSYGWGDDQWGCLDSLWMRESGWNHTAMNPSSGAYGIPQSLPGNKMATAGADWQTNPATQIRWGLGYIQGRYGSPCGAWAHSQAVGWY